MCSVSWPGLLLSRTYNSTFHLVYFISRSVSNTVLDEKQFCNSSIKCMCRDCILPSLLYSMLSNHYEYCLNTVDCSDGLTCPCYCITAVSFYHSIIFHFLSSAQPKHFPNDYFSILHKPLDKRVAITYYSLLLFSRCDPRLRCLPIFNGSYTCQLQPPSNLLLPCIFILIIYIIIVLMHSLHF